LTLRLRNAGRIAAVISPHQTVEEAYLLAKLVRQFDADALLALGPVPVVGEDERFASGFTIRAEKCPNRRGVEAVLRHFTGGVTTFDELLDRLEAERVKAVWIAAGYREPWGIEEMAERLASVETLIVQDMFDSPVWRRATFQLPGASFAERAGSYVNFADRLQLFDWAIRPPAGVWIEGHLFWRMLGMHRVYKPRTVLSEIAATIGYFAAAADEVPPTGIDLKVNQLAGVT
jgi:NADH-quinone oxidoreductase subunit G